MISATAMSPPAAIASHRIVVRDEDIGSPVFFIVRSVLPVLVSADAAAVQTALSQAKGTK